MSDQSKLGARLPHWTPPPLPSGPPLDGTHVRLERLNPDIHAADLYRAYSGQDALWTYMYDGPFASASSYHRWTKEHAGSADTLFYVLRDTATGHCGGVASYLRMAPAAGSIEVGSICIAPELARSRAWTESMFLMMEHVFSLGYRRYEWKCNALNIASRRASRSLRQITDQRIAPAIGQAQIDQDHIGAIDAQMIARRCHGFSPAQSRARAPGNQPQRLTGKAAVLDRQNGDALQGQFLQPVISGPGPRPGNSAHKGPCRKRKLWRVKVGIGALILGHGTPWRGVGDGDEWAHAVNHGFANVG